MVKKAIGEIINIGTQEQISVIDSAKIIHKIANTGKKLRLKFIPLEEIFGTYKDIERREPDLSKAKLLLGYEPKVAFVDGVSKTIITMKNR